MGQNIYGSKSQNIEAILGTASERYLDFLQSKEAEEWINQVDVRELMSELGLDYVK